MKDVWRYTVTVGPYIILSYKMLHDKKDWVENRTHTTHFGSAGNALLSLSAGMSEAATQNDNIVLCRSLGQHNEYLQR